MPKMRYIPPNEEFEFGAIEQIEPTLQQISPEQFAVICFLVLMQNQYSLISKAPNYIAEKYRIITDGYDAFGYLDLQNQVKVMDWLEHWNVQIPEPIAKYWNASYAR